MIERIPMSAPDIDEHDIQAVVEVLQSGRLSLGPKTEAFEGAVCSYVGVRHAVAVSSGTAALHLIVKALKLGPGDEVVVPSFTFAASVNVLLYEGVTPVFCDIENRTYNLDPEDLERRITPRTKAILAVDVFGHPAEWKVIDHLSVKYGLRVIDDSCEALGAEYEGRKLGQFGDAAAFAFYANKQITTGEGGMLVTNDDDIADAARSLRNQGRGKMGAWLEHERLGFNYRMDEMSAALGLSQLRRIETFIERRKRVAENYSRLLRDVPYVRVPIVNSNVRMSWFVYVVTLSKDIDRESVIESLNERGNPARCYFPPVHLQKYISRLTGGPIPDLPVTDSVAARTLALPFHNRITPDHVEEVIQVLRQVVVKA
jgi:perosamine synthetase